MNGISIDWTKIEANPDKEVKVIGSLLLDFKAKVQDQTIEINNHYTENEKLQGEKQRLQALLQSAQGYGTLLETKMQELNSAISTKDEQILQLTSETAKVKELEDQIVDLKSQVEGFQSEKQGLLGEKDDLTSKVAMLEQKAESAEQQLGEAGQSASSLQSQLDDLKKQVEDVTSQLDDAKSNISDKDSSIANLKKELREKEVILEAKDFEYFKNLRKQKAQQIDEASK